MSSSTPPAGMAPVPMEYWESLRTALRPNKETLNGHRGYFAYHNDDCRCVLGDHYCNRQGHIWSCCGSTGQYSGCKKRRNRGNA